MTALKFELAECIGMYDSSLCLTGSLEPRGVVFGGGLGDEADKHCREDGRSGSDGC